MRRFLTVVAVAVLAIASALLLSRVRGGTEEGSTREIWSGHAKKFRGRAADPKHEDRAALAGRVLDENGAGIAEASVCASGSSEQLASEDIDEPRCVKSADDGAWRLDDLFAATWRVSAAAPRRRPARWRAPEGGATSLRLAPGQTRDGIDLVLLPGGLEVRGRVKDASGGMVAGARVTISNGGVWVAPTVVTSDESGEFSGWASEGAVSVTATADGYAPGAARGRVPGAPIEVLLTPESTLAGIVVDAKSKKPVAGARVSTNELDDWERKRAITDAQGRFRITGLEPGRYKPAAETPGRAGQALESVLLGLGETRDGIVIEVHEARIVAGRVILESGEPCEDGGVTLQDARRGTEESTTIERNGNVVFKALLPGTYEPAVRCTGKLSEEKYEPVEVAASDVDGLVWKVRDGVAIRGIVENDAGEPVAGALLRLRPEGGDPRSSRSGGFAASANDGTFALKGLASGTYALEADADGHVAPELPPIDVANSDVDDLRIRLERGGDIEGEVVDASGAPLVGASVRATAEAQRRMMGFWREPATTLADGTFTLKGLAPGVHRVTAMRAGEPTIRAFRGPRLEGGQKVTVVSGVSARVRIVLAAATDEIRGFVHDANGGPVPDAFVDAEPEEGDASEARRGLRRTWSRQPAIAGKDGSFVLPNLAAGTYVVRAYRKGGGEALAEGVKTGTSITLALRTTGTLSGTVEMDGGGSPPETFSIAVSGDGGFQRKEPFYRSSGRWLLRDLPPGTYKIAVDAPEGTAVVENVELAEGALREGVRIVLAPRATVRGTVVDFETNEPVSGIMVMVSDQSEAFRFRSGGRPGENNISDADGRFEVRNAPTGDVSVVVFDMSRRMYGFARVPVTLAAGEERELAEPIRLKKRESDDTARTGYLGFAPELQPAEAKLSDRRWTVKRVFPDSPAARAGLAEGDVILKVNGQDVTGSSQYLFNGLVRVAPGQTVSLELERGETLSITAVERP